MSKQKILVVDDEEDILELVKYNLDREGFEVVCCASGEEALQRISEDQPDLVVLDLMLPGINGLDVCRSVKGDSDTRKLPIVMLTAKGEEADIVTGLELGADDYITKPFSPRVLLARVRAVLRREATDGATLAEQIVRAHEIAIDTQKHQVFVKEDQLELTSTQFRILHFLAKNPGWVFTRSQIVDAVHGSDYPVTDRSIDVQIVGLRKKLGDCGEYIETIRGVGYRFKE